MLITLAVYAVCFLVGDYANRKTNFFHPIGWAGLTLAIAGVVVLGVHAI